MARGAVWMVLFKMLELSLGLVSMLILARLLFPEDFGLVAMATSLIALLELFAMFGMDTGLIQRHDATPEHFNSAWTLNVLASSGIAVMMLLLALPAAYFYQEPRVTAVICVLACGALRDSDAARVHAAKLLGTRDRHGPGPHRESTLTVRE